MEARLLPANDPQFAFRHNDRDYRASILFSELQSWGENPNTIPSGGTIAAYDLPGWVGSGEFRWVRGDRLSGIGVRVDGRGERYFVAHNAIVMFPPEGFYGMNNLALCECLFTGEATP